MAIYIEQIERKDVSVWKQVSDRSIYSVSRCVDIGFKKFHPNLRRIGVCGGKGSVSGYCGNGTTFIAQDGSIKVSTKVIDGRSEIWITHTGELSASAIDAAAECQ